MNKELSELPVANTFYVGPAQTGTANYNTTLRILHALNSAAKFWGAKIDNNREVTDHNGLMVLAALYSIVDNIHGHSEVITKALGGLKGDLSNTHLPRALKTMNQKVINYGEQKFTLAGRFTAKFTDEDKGFEWLKEIEEFGAVKFSIHHATLNSIVKRKIEDELITPPEHVEVRTTEYVKITKA